MNGLIDCPSSNPTGTMLPFKKEDLDRWQSRVNNARPFLKWAGGKQPFVARYGQHFPQFHGRYFEPFLGGGALFFFLARREVRPFSAVLSDQNRGLIHSFREVQQDPVAVYRRLSVLMQEFHRAEDPSAMYYQIRSQFNGSRLRPDAAQFLFLNRTCWNGLYRVNQRGEFNVPFGAPKGPGAFPAESDLIAAAAALVQAELRTTSWENATSLADPGDFVFLDPPYFSDTLVGDTKYQMRQFDIRDHEQLADFASSLSRRRVNFVLTNSGEEEMELLYRRHGLNVIRVQVPRSINSKTELRKSVDELIVTPSWQRFGEE